MILLSGCADGPFAELAAWNPWIRREWLEDEDYAPTFHKRLAELRSLQASAAGLTPADQERFAQQALDLVATDPNPLLRAEAVRTLSRLPTPTVLPGLRIAARDADEQVRVAACQAWGQRGDAEALEALADILRRDEDLDVRIAATQELGRFRDPPAVSALGLALNDTDPALQYGAVESLKSSTGRDFGDSVPAWRDYVAGGTPEPARSPSVVERLRHFF
ncbi:MAG: HEAT repeat domain-containing protein [Pirellulaceae bacterium]